jgi:hemolysin activation/secretion protein
VNAELKPTGIPGESLLEIILEETSPYSLAFSFDNHRAPSIGAERLYLSAAHNNLTGNSDSLSLRYGLTRNGFKDMKFGDDQDIAGYYTFPVNHRGTTFELSASKNDTLIVEEPFDQFDITSESTTYGFALRHPLYRKFDREVSVSLTGERRNNKTFFDGEPFSFSLGSQDGETTVSVLRFGINGLKRSQSGVIAAYSAISVGLDVLDSTQNTSTIPDSNFVSWQGQMQYIQRLFDTDTQLVSKVSAQLTADPLLSMEQFSLGGVNSVRGYRENQVIRDNGVAGSLELRIPLVTDKAGRFLLRLAPFVDYGYGWNKRGGETVGGGFTTIVLESEDLWSVGVGLLFNPHPQVTGQLYWGYAFQDFEASDYDLQDDGIHFLFTVNVF